MNALSRGSAEEAISSWSTGSDASARARIRSVQSELVRRLELAPGDSSVAVKNLGLDDTHPNLRIIYVRLEGPAGTLDGRWVARRFEGDWSVDRIQLGGIDEGVIPAAIENIGHPQLEPARPGANTGAAGWSKQGRVAPQR